MFWKKSHSKDPDSNQLFVSPEELRNSFRVTPSLSEPVDLTLDNKKVSLFDISSGGLRCENKGFSVGSLYSFHMFLPGIDRKILGKIEVREIIKMTQCRCRFRDLAPEFEDLIHRYNLNRQKEVLEKTKKRRDSQI